MIDLTKRNDVDLAFMLRFENVAWYEKGEVRILDRRIYPIRTEFVTCKTYEEVAKAIGGMVTQSEGPYIAAAMGMALAAYQAKDQKISDIPEFLTKAAYALSHARPTTSAQMERIVNESAKKIINKLNEGGSLEDLVNTAFEYAYNYENEKYAKYTIIGKNIADLIPNNGSILTQCFAGTVVGTMLRELHRNGKKVKVYCAETRPYFQGARLTASVACDMGFDVTVICDNMPNYTLKTKKIDLFTSASDVITMDGHVVNKVGTSQIALCAHHLGIPFYVTGTPDQSHPDMSSVVIEERDPNLAIESMGQRLTMPGVKGYYPAFDVTDPEYVTGIVTEKGTYTPENVHNYFD
ncbi:MAG: s-methyl-5-thioribose-1-phosphate isomerase [Solobacterium sp.]|jgi:methylthioribose-1-phosphate isomerase|nr:s-methyl-5-thioribose-1-phosphate isomerase [Solobacterium sp.]